MTKRLVLADDVTGEFDGGVDAQLKNTFVAVEGAPADGDAIVWDETTEQWVPAPVEGGSSLTVLSEAEGDAGVATTARAISAERLKQQIEQHGITVIPGNVVRGLIVETGTEVRPAADVVVWIDPDELGAVNALATDPIITPGAAELPPGGTTGQALVKASDSDGDVSWGSVGGSSAAPVFKASINPPLANMWVIPAHVVSTTQGGHEATALGVMSLVRWDFAEEVTVSGIAVDIYQDPGAGGVVRVGIYDSLTATGPIAGTEKVITAETQGTKEDTSLAVTIPAGTYWVACVPQVVSTMNLRTMPIRPSFRYWEGANNAFQLNPSWGAGIIVSRFVSGVTGALPSLASSTLTNSTHAPRTALLRIA